MIKKVYPIKTKRWALENGFTHHGYFLGVPVWLSEPFNTITGPEVCAKNWVCDILFDLAQGFFNTLISLDLVEPMFPLVVGSTIENDETL